MAANARLALSPPLSIAPEACLCLLRPGQISRTQIEQTCGLKLVNPETLNSEAPRASGTLESHYAPTAKVRLMSTARLAKSVGSLGAACTKLGFVVSSETIL